jgi:hypothetical protein
MSAAARDEVRIIDRVPIGEGLRSLADRWHEQRRAQSPVDAGWVELVCVYDDDPDGRQQQLRLAVPPTAAGAGDAVDVHDTEMLGWITPVAPGLRPPAALAAGQPPDTVDNAECREIAPLTQMRLAHRLEGSEHGWAAHCDRPAQNHYDELLGQIEAIYPDEGDPAEMARLAHATLSHLDELPALAVSHNSGLEPESAAGAIWHLRRAERNVALPVLVVLQWALANRDRGLIAELDAAIGAHEELTAWHPVCATVLERIDTAELMIDAIGSEPGSVCPTPRESRAPGRA